MGQFEQDLSGHRENRGNPLSKDQKREFNKCFACMSKSCKEIIVKIDSIIVNLAKKDTEVNLCEIYTVEKASKEEKVLILDVGSCRDEIEVEGMSWSLSERFPTSRSLCC